MAEGSALGYTIKRSQGYAVESDPGFRYFCGDVADGSYPAPEHSYDD